ncbi:MAG: GAF domain-containing protein [Anaerolineales bacterium]|nr:GAF domain-containing protein [Anaerolineales bacterium]
MTAWPDLSSELRSEAAHRWPARVEAGLAVQTLLELALHGLEGRPAGIAWSAGASAYEWLAAVGLPAAWRAQLADPLSGLCRQLEAARAAGRRLADVDAGLGALTILPFELPEAGRGAVCLGGEAWPAEALRQLAALGPLAGRLWQTARRDEPARAASQEQAALHRIATALTSTLQLDEILTSTIDGIRQILNVEAASLLLLDEERGELIFKKTLGEDPDWIFQYSMPMERGLVSEAMRDGRPLLVNDVAADGRFSAHVDAATGFSPRSVLCAPLIAHGQTLGAIELVNKRGGAFDPHDQDLLVSMAASVANAIYNARLYHQLTIANADLEASRWEVMRSRNTLRALFDGIPHPMYIVDHAYRLVALNRACVQLSSPEPAAAPAGEANPFSGLVGQVCHTALYHRAEPCAGCRMAETLYAGQNAQRTERRWGADDQMSEWDISTYPILDERGQTIQVVVFGQNVTEKRRLEASLAQSEKLAAVGQLAAGVAHEINNPLAAIIANAQLLKRELSPDDERQESVSLITMASDRALQVVRNLLDFARQDRYEFAPTDINLTLQNAVAVAGPLLRDAALRLTLDLAADLPPIQASQDHLQGVWLNFLLNARDALSAEGGEIRISTRRHGSDLQILVADTGMGIQPERLNRIFEPFYTTKQAGRGTGLGLYTCHRIVKQHGGQIRVDSQVGHGTVFTVVLPVLPPPSAV